MIQLMATALSKDTEELAANINVPRRRALQTRLPEDSFAIFSQIQKGKLCQVLPSTHTHHFIWMSHRVIKFNWVDQWKTIALTTSFFEERFFLPSAKEIILKVVSC